MSDSFSSSMFSALTSSSSEIHSLAISCLHLHVQSPGALGTAQAQPVLRWSELGQARAWPGARRWLGVQGAMLGTPPTLLTAGP